MIIFLQLTDQAWYPMRKCAIKLYTFSVALVISSQPLIAGLTETLPTYHWAYQYMEELRLRGFFSELNFARRPFTRGEIAESLVDHLIAGWATDEIPKAVWLLDELYEEFAEEMNLVRRAESGDIFSIGILTQANVGNDGEETDDSESFRINGGFQVGKGFGIYNTMNFDSDLSKDSTFEGREWRGMSAFTEQGYMQYESTRFTVLFGRDFKRWGIGKRSTLLISDHSRPMDQLSAELSIGPVELSFIAAELDKLEGMRRFLSAHRVDININNSLNIGISELLIYGGENASPVAAFTNPALVFHGENLNDASQSNTLGSIDVLWYPKRNWRISGAILIDDIQLDNKELEDLEPNEIGLIVGVQKANPFGFDGVDSWVEYVRITNRTYTTPNIEETLKHRNRPIGYFLGNDFDSWEFGTSSWLKEGIKISLSLTLRRDGEGGIDKLFMTPWLDKDIEGNPVYTIESGYSEDFPTGVVQEFTEFKLSVEKSFSSKLRVTFDYEHIATDNLGHVLDESESDNKFFLNVWYDFNYLLNL